MRKLTRLWQALESTPGLCDVAAQWEQICGADYPLVRQFLRPLDEVGARYPCPRPRDGDCPRRVVDYGDRTFAAVCSHPHKLCQDVSLQLRDALLYGLDLVEMVRPMADALCVRCQSSRLRAQGVWELGLSTSLPTRNQPVFLLVFSGRNHFASAIGGLILDCSTPFVAIAPTSKYVSAGVREKLVRHRSHFISMEERIGLFDDGRFGALEHAPEDIAPTPVEQRQAVVEKYNRDFTYTDAQICKDGRVDKSDFYKWIKGELKDNSVKSKRIEEVLRTAPSSRTRR